MRLSARLAFLASAASALAACTGGGEGVDTTNGNAAAPGTAAAAGRPFEVEVLGSFDEPWAMAFLPNGTLLVTQRSGALRLRVENGSLIDVAGAPRVDAGGQGGLGDIAIHPDFRRNGFVYLSWVEAGQGDTRGAVVGRAQFVRTEDGASLSNLQVIWRQAPKVTGRGHFGHRLAFSPDGRHLFITNGDRQKFDPAQDPAQHLGKIVRLNADGSTPADNPWASQGGVTAQLWTTGHRNPLGLAFDGAGRLWQHEMGPQGGDEFNLIERGRNYGYPIVSNGSHYDGRDIPDHSTRPEFRAPVITWTGVSPAGLMIYSGRLFRGWRGNAFLGALSGEALIRVQIDGATAREAQRWPMAARIREIEEGPDGAIYVLEDERNNAGGRLLRLTPAG